MKTKKLCITLDLEPFFAGLIPMSYESLPVSHFTSFLQIVEKYNIRLTVFVVGKLLEQRQPIVERLQEIGAEFELHSYSHKLNSPDSEFEIKEGKKAFNRYFSKNPIGYRAPQGLISNDGLFLLNQEGFKYDSSIFPSFWPSPKYIRFSRLPFQIQNTDLIEIPFATLPLFRLIISMSWIKLLGWSIYKSLFSVLNTPDIFVLDTHLHDFYTPENNFSMLPFFWKLVFSRNHRNGINIFEKFIEHMNKMGYQFCYLSEIYNEIKK